MKGTYKVYKFGYLVFLVLFAATACVPTWLGDALDLSAETDVIPVSATNVDTKEIVQAVLAQIELEQAEQIPIIYDAPPAVESIGNAENLEETLTELYRQVNPSVVYIITSSGATGSGFVYDQDGHIVTNYHVAAASKSYEVVFANGERFRAELVGSDVDSDLAVLRIDSLPEGIVPLPLAESDQIQVGQLAIAIGNPFGEQGSMSLGIVSGLGRSLRSQRETTTGSTYSLPQVIQTDAPINPGNSGGPLLNLEGQVIGVNAAIASTSGTSSGVGFSIPVAAVKRIVPHLIAEGEYIFPYMGASFDDVVSLDDQAIYDISQTYGAYVVAVTPNSPAERAGLIAANPQTGRDGDLIVEMDGQDIRDFSDLNAYLVFHTEVGQTIEITVLRGSERVQLLLELGVRPL